MTMICIICQERPATDSAGGDVVLCSPCATELRQRNCPSCNGSGTELRGGLHWQREACGGTGKSTGRLDVPSR